MDIEITTNYRYRGYAFKIGEEENIFYYKLYWGPHPEIVKNH
jgi:hypothetical protein